MGLGLACEACTWCAVQHALLLVVSLCVQAVGMSRAVSAPKASGGIWKTCEGCVMHSTARALLSEQGVRTRLLLLFLPLL